MLFEEFPVELIQSVLGFMDSRSLLSTMMTCKKLRSLGEPILYSHVVFSYKLFKALGKRSHLFSLVRHFESPEELYGWEEDFESVQDVEEVKQIVRIMAVDTKVDRNMDPIYFRGEDHNDALFFFLTTKFPNLKSLQVNGDYYHSAYLVPFFANIAMKFPIERRLCKLKRLELASEPESDHRHNGPSPYIFHLPQLESLSFFSPLGVVRRWPEQCLRLDHLRELQMTNLRHDIESLRAVITAAPNLLDLEAFIQPERGWMGEKPFDCTVLGDALRQCRRLRRLVIKAPKKYRIQSDEHEIRMQGSIGSLTSLSELQYLVISLDAFLGCLKPPENLCFPATDYLPPNLHTLMFYVDMGTVDPGEWTPMDVYETSVVCTRRERPPFPKLQHYGIEGYGQWAEKEEELVGSLCKLAGLSYDVDLPWHSLNHLVFGDED
ncbi:uncharacterized protein K452DRAFT_302217 [Aplosporella prunicola CBS 121167]|uniref:F-box domain-containing protein n=1 Tax=Aplosporella prunicola CBS 121167 TaxID=1176127 RepID=A0A6A6AYP4_9PEZI|nr:uncharacterized protein K452DRAFT_302217 [Aplosporella prunicola CBS 121167]KAF2137049.1 hypothetical protein K452DRAFT_302217 [Aplosporella prunicola CBS 121167]